MKAKLMVGGAAMALTLAGIGIETRLADSKAQPFVDPIALAKSMCGLAPDAERTRRGYFAAIGAAYAKSHVETAAPGASPAKYGAIAYKITANAQAQTSFNRGVAHLWNFNHGAAIAAFKAAQAADPQCAMCWWGEAFAYGPNINAPMAGEAVAPAFAAAKKAKDLAKGASAKEQDLIAALLKRYAKAPVRDRAPLDAAFADAMDAVALKHPDDDFVLALAAEANLDTQPWDYWEADGRTPKGRTARTISLIEAILARNPEHIPAIHLYIHATEATTDPYRAVKFADLLDDLSPGLGHLIHMPSHVYYRIGRFRQSIDLNLAAVEADEAFLAAEKAEPMYEFGYYVHNVHFVMMSALMAGDARTALAMAEKLDRKLPAAMAGDIPFAQPIKAAPYFVWGAMGDPKATLELPDPGADIPFLHAAWRYARGEAYARLGETGKARAEAAAIGKIIAEDDLSPLEELAIPATAILKIEQRTLIARAAAGDGDLKSAVAAMEEVVALQGELNYTEPPYWYYPAKQTLAAYVLRNGDAERAEQLFIETLAEAPNSGWALHGLAEAYRAQGDKAAQKYANALFRNAWAGDQKAISLTKL